MGGVWPGQDGAWHVHPVGLAVCGDVCVHSGRAHVLAQGDGVALLALLTLEELQPSACCKRCGAMWARASGRPVVNDAIGEM